MIVIYLERFLSCFILFASNYDSFVSALSADPTDSINNTDSTSIGLKYTSLGFKRVTGSGSKLAAKHSIGGTAQIPQKFPRRWNLKSFRHHRDTHILLPRTGGARVISFPGDGNPLFNLEGQSETLNQAVCNVENKPKAAAACAFCECYFGVLWGCSRTSLVDRTMFKKTSKINRESRRNPELQDQRLPASTLMDKFTPENWCIEEAGCFCTDAGDLVSTAKAYLEERQRLGLDFTPQNVVRYSTSHYTFGNTGLGVPDPLQEFPYRKVPPLKKRGYTGAQPIKNITAEICK